MCCTDGFNKHLDNNLKFLMFENFKLNQQNFIHELKLIEEAQAYRQNLSNWYEHVRTILVNFKAKKLDLELPMSIFCVLRKFIIYKHITMEHLKIMSKVIFFEDVLLNHP